MVLRQNGREVDRAFAATKTVPPEVLYLPLAALVVNGGDALEADAPAPVLSTRAHVLLFALWTVTAWGAAALAYAAG